MFARTFKVLIAWRENALGRSFLVQRAHYSINSVICVQEYLEHTNLCLLLQEMKLPIYRKCRGPLSGQAPNVDRTLPVKGSRLSKTKCKQAMLKKPYYNELTSKDLGSPRP